MGIPPQISSLLPFSKDDMYPFDPSQLDIPADELQIQADAINLLEGRVSIDSFTPEYAKKIKDYYRFSAFRQGSKQGNVAKRTKDTLDII